jgi:uncharacterized protein YndB with AHSA1/START domain
MAKKKPAAKKGSAPKAAKTPAKAAKKAVAKGKAKAPAKKPVKAVPKKKSAPVAKKAAKPVPKKPVKQVVAKTAPKPSSAKAAADKPQTKPAKPAPAQAQPKAAVSKKVEEVKKAAPPAAVKSAPAPAKGAVKKEEAPKKAIVASPAKNGVPAAPSPAPIAIKAPAAKAKKEVKEKEPFVAVMTGYDPLGGPAKSLKRAAKERYVLEFYLRATPGSLYDLISTPSGFSEWFCDDVDVRGDQFTFQWGSDEQIATCLGRKYGEMIRFHWENDDDPGSFFELRIRIDPMTNETCLVVTDHAWAKDVEESKALWASQIHTLQRVLGA